MIESKEGTTLTAMCKAHRCVLVAERGPESQTTSGWMEWIS
jgi:hypothetical protein